MKPEKLRNKSWYPYAVAACIAVALYALLTHMGSIWRAVCSFGGYFGPIVLGCVVAYLMNPLARLYERKLFRRIGREPLRWTLSVALAVVTVLLLLGFVLGTLIPQLGDSIMTLVSNLDGYIASLHALAERMGVAETLNLEQIIGSSGSIMKRIAQLLSDNLNNIVSASATAGKSIANWVIALILSVYLLTSKKSLKGAVTRLLRALLPEKRFAGMTAFLSRCDNILIRYITFSLLDAIIVGVANAVFMAIFGMQYVGLVSVVVAMTNLIPTFGPVVGCAIGMLVLLLVRPVHALAFLIFTLVIQFLDAYVIKPRLFGNSLGVSGLLILMAIIVCGNMFGVVGILVAIPLAAIVDFLYRDYLLPALEARKARGA